MVSLGDMTFCLFARDRDAGEGLRDLPGATLLDLGDVELQEAVEPLHEFLPVGGIACQFASRSVSIARASSSTSAGIG